MDNRKRLPTPATGAPVPGTSGWVTRQQGPGARRRARGRSPGGRGVPPHAKERPRRGPEAGGLFYSAPWGPDIGIPARARPTLIADKHSRSLCL